MNQNLYNSMLQEILIKLVNDVVDICTKSAKKESKPSETLWNLDKLIMTYSQRITELNKGEAHGTSN